MKYLSQGFQHKFFGLEVEIKEKETFPMPGHEQENIFHGGGASTKLNDGVRGSVRNLCTRYELGSQPCIKS